MFFSFRDSFYLLDSSGTRSGAVERLKSTFPDGVDRSVIQCIASYRAFGVQSSMVSGPFQALQAEFGTLSDRMKQARDLNERLTVLEDIKRFLVQLDATLAKSDGDLFEMRCNTRRGFKRDQPARAASHI